MMSHWFEILALVLTAYDSLCLYFVIDDDVSQYTVQKTDTFISIDKDGVNIQEIYCISLDLYIRIFPSPNLP